MTRPALDDRLRAAGLRVTRPRIAVLETVEAWPHSDAESVHARLAGRHPSLSVQSVHNVLRALTAGSLLRRIEPADSPALYEARVGDNHHHAVCRECGSVRDIPCTVGHAPCLDPGDADGFTVDLAEVVFWGLCAGCRDRGVPMTATPESPRRSHD
ncbi:Fur family transcriptional regulator [Pseudolysinimonas sp.]|uniref:Fur family transcriptional regulator n=1 Tax=Pseudolysinimonas sp. TaxID=2680009 RepID=UPI00286C186A|nr:Fur family transcriptional regulator [Pseudolysinimonas sp.]